MSVIHDAPGDDYCGYCARNFYEYPYCQCGWIEMCEAHNYGLANPPVMWGASNSVPESNHPAYDIEY